MDIKDLTYSSGSAFQPIQNDKSGKNSEAGVDKSKKVAVNSDQIQISSRSYQKLKDQTQARDILTRTADEGDTEAIDERLVVLKQQIQQGTYLNSRRDASISRQMFSIWSKDESIE